MPDRRPTILVVEDDPVLRTFYRSALAIAGYAVVAVADGISALQWIESDLPSLILLDLSLPRLGGRDVQRELKSHANTRHIPIMVVSGADMGDLRPDDFACVMRKPITVADLIAAIQKILLPVAGRWVPTGG